MYLTLLYASFVFSQTLFLALLWGLYVVLNLVAFRLYLQLYVKR